MWIKLDFTPLFWDSLIAGLVLIAIGFAIRSSSPSRSTLGLVVIIAGVIPALAGGVLLALDAIGKQVEARQNRHTFEKLTADRDIQGIRIPSGSTVDWLGSYLSAVKFGHPTTILGIQFQDTLSFTNTLTNGDRLAATELDTGVAANSQSIDDVPCRAGSEIAFFTQGGSPLENGRRPRITRAKLKRCTLAADFDFARNRYPAGSEITFNSFGGVALGVLAADQDVDGRPCQGGSEVERPEARAIRFTLARDQTIGGIACKAGHEVHLEETQGRVTQAVLAHDQEIDGTPCRGGEPAAFGYREGAYPLESCVLSRPFPLLDIVWPAGSSVAGLSMTWLQVTTPVHSPEVKVGELTLSGPVRIQFDKQTRVVSSANTLDTAPSAIRFRGGWFSDFNIYQAEGYGHLARGGPFESIPYQPGELVRFKVAQAAPAQ